LLIALGRGRFGLYKGQDFKRCLIRLTYISLQKKKSVPRVKKWDVIGHSEKKRDNGLTSGWVEPRGGGALLSEPGGGHVQMLVGKFIARASAKGDITTGW